PSRGRLSLQDRGGRADPRPARRRGRGGARLGRRAGGHSPRAPDAVVQLLRRLESGACMSRESGTRTAGPAGVDDALSAAAVLQRLLPPEVASLFDASFLRMHLLYDEFIYRLVLQTAAETGLEAATREPGTVGEIATRAGLESPRALVPLDWMLRLLAARGQVGEPLGGGASRYRSLRGFPSLDPAPVILEQKRLDASWIPAYTLAETVARDYPAFLRGGVTGEEVLFSPRRLRLWIDYFSNDNGLYVVNNRLGALAVGPWLPRPRGTTLA